MKELIINKYKQIFLKDNTFENILRECRDILEDCKGKIFKIEDFKKIDDYTNNLKQIDLYRKYVELDNFINEKYIIGEGLILYNPNNNKVSYRDILAAIDLFEEKFANNLFFYIKDKDNKESNNIKSLSIVMIDKIFEDERECNKIFYVETNKKYYFSYNYDMYSFVFEMPFVNLSNTSVVNAYLYLLKEYIHNNFKTVDKTKEFSTLSKEYNLTLNIFKNDIEKNHNHHTRIFKNYVQPFLKSKYNIPLEELTGIRFVSNEDEEKAFFTKVKDYFLTLNYDLNKINEYLDKHWANINDLGYEYTKYIDYNKVCTIEEIHQYKENIFNKKKQDIIFNIRLYYKWGYFKYCLNKDIPINEKFILPMQSYKEYLNNYFNSCITKKGNFNSGNDNRIDFDNNEIFTLYDLQYNSSSKYLNNSTRYFNYKYNEDNVLFIEDKNKKYSYITIDLVKFIKLYNTLFNKDILINEMWFFPIFEINNFVNAAVSSFSRNYSDSGFEEYLFNKLYTNEFFNKYFENKNIPNNSSLLQEITIPIEKLPFRHIRSYQHFINPEEKEIIPCILTISIESKDIVKIKKGTHPVFKSNNIEKSYLNRLEEKKKQKQIVDKNSLSI